jgi:glucosamine 6-phosphate synthetase-like amidotransferase/phosphosugar isomerase protein
MCGIAGSINSKRAFELYQSNLNRGCYSSGLMTIGGQGENCFEIGKTLGTFNCEHTAPVKYTLYHSRGPTVETKQFNPAHNHPFTYESWIVAHNGIVSNFDKLAREYFPEEDFTGATDSCIIPRLIHKLGLGPGLSKIEGTFAIWAYDILYRTLYLARNSCTLYANTDTGDFSSTEFEGSKLLEENLLYCLYNHTLIKLPIKIESKSPYFIL